jgi:hypothetical protein
MAMSLKEAKMYLAAIGKHESCFQGGQLKADSSYHSWNALASCRDAKFHVYIPGIQFRKRDPDFPDRPRFKDGIHGRPESDARPALFTASDFSFDPGKQVYLCPRGKELTCHARSQIKRYRTYRLPAAQETDLSIRPWVGKALYKISFSTLSLCGQSRIYIPN